MTETVQTIDGLLFGSLVPPGFENEHCVGGRQVKSYTPCLECHKHHLALLIVLEALNRMTLTFDESRATNRLLFRGMDEICDQAYTNVTASLPQIVASIRALNPDAKIVLLGYTNPVPLLPAWNRYFSKLNRFAKDLAAQEGLIYVDIPRTQTAADGHPTVKGHKYIAQQILNAIQ